MRSFLLIACFTAGALFARSVAATDVLFLGTYHMANPGHDLHNLNADDVLAEKRQRELAAISAALAKFKPSVVAVEADAVDGAPTQLTSYHDYRDGKLADSRNEIVQIGFRLAKRTQLSDVFGIDIDGDFPYEAVKAFADNGRSDLALKLDALGADIDRSLKRLDEILKSGSIGAGLRYLNNPKNIANDYAFYSSMLYFGDGKEQPGATLLSAWQARNNAICARVVQLAKPDDRMVVVYGAGHAYLLRECIREVPGFRLIEANDYLPK
jgi:Family of unknown function (DUF5694)